LLAEQSFDEALSFTDDFAFNVHSVNTIEETILKRF